jgi:hypothetical protein
MTSKKCAIAKVKAAERRVARGETKAWTFDFEVGQRLRSDDGAMYEITGLPDVGRRDRVVAIQKLVLDGAGRPLPGLREGPPFIARAGRDGVRVNQGRWARRLTQETVCAG